LDRTILFLVCVLLIVSKEITFAQGAPNCDCDQKYIVATPEWLDCEANGCKGPLSNVTDFDVEGNKNELRRFELYPNPYSEGDLTVGIRTKKVEVMEMELMNMDGTVLSSFGTKDFVRTSEGLSLRVDLEKLELSSGVYSVKCNSAEWSFIERLVITK